MSGPTSDSKTAEAATSSDWLRELLISVVKYHAHIQVLQKHSNNGDENKSLSWYGTIQKNLHNEQNN